MRTDNLVKYLEELRDLIVEESKKELASQGKTGKLYDSIEGTYVEKDSRGIHFRILMEDYGKFVDKGVKGKDPSKVKGGDKAIRGQQAPNSPYKFGSGNMRGTFDDFAKSVGDWAKSRNFRLRDEEGRFVRGTYETIGKIIAGNIYNRGLKPSLFFTKAFEKAQKQIQDKLEKGLKLDVEKDIDIIIDTYGKN